MAPSPAWYARRRTWYVVRRALGEEALRQIPGLPWTVGEFLVEIDRGRVSWSDFVAGLTFLERSGLAHLLPGRYGQMARWVVESQEVL